MVALTFDIDWAPDALVIDLMAMLDDFGVPATLFCTDFRKDASGSSSKLSNRCPDRHEIALHPNFETRDDYALTWDAMVDRYPEARGWRSHNGLTGWPILREGVARGLRYEVLAQVFDTYVSPSQTNSALPGHYTFTTAFFDSHMLLRPEFPWTADALPHRELFEDERSLVILGFHPNIVYYDMQLRVEYDARKLSYHTVDESACYRATGAPVGAMKLLQQLLHCVPVRHFSTPTRFGSKMGFW